MTFAASRRTAAVLATAAGLLAAGAVTASAKSASLLPVPCTNGTAASAVYAKQGADYRLGFAASGPGAASGIWSARIVDNGSTVLLDSTMPVISDNFEILTFASLAKGTHALAFSAVNLTTGETCATTIVSKV